MLSGGNSSRNNMTLAPATASTQTLHHSNHSTNHHHLAHHHHHTQPSRHHLCTVSSNATLHHDDVGDCEAEGVIVITSPPDDGVVEIGVGDTLSHHHLSRIDEGRPSHSPSPPSSSYKLIPGPSLHQSLQLHSTSSYKQGLDDDARDDDDMSYDQSIRAAINHDHLHSLTINELHDEEDMSVKDTHHSMASEDV